MTDQHLQIQTEVIPLLRPYARKIALYGSLARGDARADSDMDLLVVLRPAGERPLLGLRWFALEQALAERLNRPVEMVTEDALDLYLRPAIERDSVVLYRSTNTNCTSPNLRSQGLLTKY